MKEIVDLVQEPAFIAVVSAAVFMVIAWIITKKLNL